MEAKRLSVGVASANFRVGHHVRISKEKMKFVKAAEHKFVTEIFRITKVIYWRSRSVYDLDDLNGTPIYGQFYQKELTSVRITSRKNYKIDKILDKRVRRGIPEYIVRLRGYIRDFESCVQRSSVTNI
jgi:hypothetical protein